MVEPVSFGLSKSGLQKSSSKNNLAAMGGGAGVRPSQPAAPARSPKKDGAPTLLKRSRSMGTFGHYINFGQQAVEEISGKVGIAPAAGAQGQTGAQTAVTSAGVQKGAQVVPASAGSTTSGAVSAAGSATSAGSGAPGVGTAGAGSQSGGAAGGAGSGTDAHGDAGSDAGTDAPGAAAEAHDAAPAAAGTASAASPLDDNNLHHLPMARVDYFSHEWNESDLAGSWRYIVSRRQDMANSARLENASWRTWAKAKYNLKTVRPETVNWLKDYDVTWLYGPLYHERPTTEWDRSEPSTPQETEVGRKADSVKSILKKKTIAEIMLEDSPDYKGPTDNYLRHHNYRHQTHNQTNIARVVNAQYSRPQTQEVEDRRVHFNARVEQCIALDPEEQQPQPQPSGGSDHSDSESDSEEGGLFLGIRRSNSSSTVRELSTIAPLPATTLNLPDDEEEEEVKPATTSTRTYDYGSVYTEPTFKIVDPEVEAVAVPASVASGPVAASAASANGASPIASASAASPASPSAARATPASPSATSASASPASPKPINTASASPASPSAAAPRASPVSPTRQPTVSFGTKR